MTLEYLFFLLVGRLVIYVFEKFVTQNEVKIKFIQTLAHCLLCSGVWAYSLIALLLGYSAFMDWNYTGLLPSLITGVVSAVFVFYLEMGYKAVHEVIIVD